MMAQAITRLQVLMLAWIGYSLVPGIVAADGGLLPPYGKDVWEPSQVGFIRYEASTRTEDLILMPEFEGDTRDFGWIVPVPSVPDLESGNRTLFYDCARLTYPIHRNRGDGWGCGEYLVPNPPAWRFFGDEDVNVISQTTVGILHALTLGAGDSAALADSLEQWGYLHDENRVDVESALQFYVDKSWYFVAMKIDTTQVPEYWGGYWYGAIDPVRFTFETPEVVYPMRISAFSAEDPTQVLLYVCADHRMTYPGAATEYANRFAGHELLQVKTAYPVMGTLLTEGCFLTKLRRNFLVSEITDDIVLEPAPSDEEFRQIQYSGLPATEILFVAMVGLVVICSWRSRAGRGEQCKDRFAVYG
jgi:hypothetical protein